MIEWQDKTGWSQKDSEETKRTPRTWRATVGPFKLTVTRHVHYEPDQWIMTCKPLFEHVIADSKEIEEAKKQAVLMVQEDIFSIAKKLKGSVFAKKLYEHILGMPECGPRTLKLRKFQHVIEPKKSFIPTAVCD